MVIVAVTAGGCHKGVALMRSITSERFAEPVVITDYALIFVSLKVLTSTSAPQIIVDSRRVMNL